MDSKWIVIVIIINLFYGHDHEYMMIDHDIDNDKKELSY